jgi:hypothetical protein
MKAYRLLFHNLIEGIFISEQYADNVQRYEPILGRLRLTPLWLPSGHCRISMNCFSAEIRKRQNGKFQTSNAVSGHRRHASCRLACCTKNLAPRADRAGIISRARGGRLPMCQ